MGGKPKWAQDLDTPLEYKGSGLIYQLIFRNYSYVGLTNEGFLKRLKNHKRMILIKPTRRLYMTWLIEGNPQYRILERDIKSCDLLSRERYWAEKTNSALCTKCKTYLLCDCLFLRK